MIWISGNTPEDPYDARTRTWYKGAEAAEGISWTGVYVFHSDGLPGVTASIAHRDVDGSLLGVLSVDVGLVDLSLFLAGNIRVGSSGEAFLLDEAGQIIAVRDKNDLVVTEPAGGRRLRTLAQSPLPAVAALAAIPSVGRFLGEVFQNPELKLTIRYEVDGVDWVCTLRSIKVGGSRSWVAGVLAREDEFLAAARAANRRSLLLALGLALLALIAGILLARIISRGLFSLVEESQRVRRMELETCAARSPFREVDDVLGSFESMKAGLRAFQKYVPVRLVRQLLEDRQEPELGGSVRTLTILFSDIRGFTSISEKLEGLNKVFGTQVLVSEDTATLVSARFCLRKLAQVAVVGRARPVTVFELVGTLAEVGQARLDAIRAYEEALDLYLARDFAAALAMVRRLVEANPADGAAAWLLRRCEALVADPPPPGWTGVLTMEGK